MSDGVVRDDTRGFLIKTIEVGGSEFKYVIYVPATYNPSQSNPAIIFLNGAGECGTDGLKQLGVGLGTAVMKHAERWPFIVIFPQKQTVESNWEDEDVMVLAELKAARAEYNIDQSRIYLTGISQGGHGTWAIGSRHPDLFAAIAPICGWGDEKLAPTLVKMPIWNFHGDADNVVPIERSLEMVKYLKATGGSCKQTIYPGVQHGSWDNAYDEEDLPRWFLQHSK
ncbi:MAG: prolyl oligopeptidase family serine peptidase [Armatimonadota bacterium]|nr:prolyl oligopeptidase family serine peptidase [bacterium]